MLARSVAFAGLVASAAAFSPSMSLAGRREVVQAGAAAAAVTPFLGSLPAGAKMDKSARAPEITIFDHRGCSRAPKEYAGAKAGTSDDEMCVKVASTKVEASLTLAEKKLQEFLSYQAKGIDGDYTGVVKRVGK
ncbi:phycoerythrin alpha subunit 11 [Guillardia theta CCMP2712]|uniref:Phycoerythrin alpha subunit 11 n=2 Tax=Guillardia theta TaxID=55529 RepID=L1JQD4_GUITC|nr:phycoerythrin alpha subunit 11 [Guillardia theta CCMP2712]EKX50677.1 phycoerythrin alpha subunit 11 [Guillardia theta CCMP2712]CAM33425.1 phycoerythrin alpha subunit 11 precursor [Guillardia theta]|eukprot:XP_005837657.1 phycoerythrin alpha subunit 11 [Guillardia theta CCMP2712]